ncbi:hypothetical protein [Fodinicurvata sp. EGI_FJ10296]|uniref:hypothetical protein n=1 Tax=Fodinicurvata sp. EGI_FJ10296 TaxID=3231908 RepID=UPI003456F48A
MPAKTLFGGLIGRVGRGDLQGHSNPRHHVRRILALALTLSRSRCCQSDAFKGVNESASGVFSHRLGIGFLTQISKPTFKAGGVHMCQPHGFQIIGYRTEFVREFPHDIVVISTNSNLRRLSVLARIGHNEGYDLL